jgi:hypothetical protein
MHITIFQIAVWNNFVFLEFIWTILHYFLYCHNFVINIIYFIYCNLSMLNFLWENLASLTILKLVDVKLFPDCSFSLHLDCLHSFLAEVSLYVKCILYNQYYSWRY